MIVGFEDGQALTLGVLTTFYVNFDSEGGSFRKIKRPGFFRAMRLCQVLPWSTKSGRFWPAVISVF
jgi:hypothetical protein